MLGFLARTFALLPPVFLVMAVLVKLVHASLARGGRTDRRTLLLATATPGVGVAVLAALLGWWPVVLDAVFSAVALAAFGKRFVRPPTFEA